LFSQHSTALFRSNPTSPVWSLETVTAIGNASGPVSLTENFGQDDELRIAGLPGEIALAASHD